MCIRVNCVVVDTGILLHGWNHLKVDTCLSSSFSVTLLENYEHFP